MHGPAMVGTGYVTGYVTGCVTGYVTGYRGNDLLP